MARYLRDFINNANRLIKAATNRRGSRQLVDTHQFPVYGIEFTIRFVDFLLETKSIVMKNLHHHHGLTQATIRVGITFAQHVHDAHATTCLRISLNARQEFLGQPSPSGQAFFANLLYLVGIEHAVSIRPKLALKLLFQNRTVLKQRVPQNYFLDNREIFRAQFPNAKNVFCKEDIRAHLGLKAAFALAASHNGAPRIALTYKPICNHLVRHATLLVEQILNNAFALGSIESTPCIAIFRPANAIELVKNAELLVKQRLLGQNLLSRKIGAVARHAHNEVFCALVLVDYAFPIPGRNNGIVHTRLALRPLESAFAM